MTPRFDALVVGAGPAGSAAAFHLSRGGASVVLADKAPVGRNKTCGDGLTAVALGELDRIGLNTRSLPSAAAVPSVNIVAPAGFVVSLPTDPKRTFAACVPRAELDRELLETAIAAGASPLLEHKLRHLQRVPEGWRATFGHHHEEHSVVTSRVVAADGAYSQVRALVDPQHGNGRSPWFAARCYVEQAETRALWVGFDPDLLPGYWWIFPIGNDRANLGFCVPRSQYRSGKALRQISDGLIDRASIRAALGDKARISPAGPMPAWPIPSGGAIAKCSVPGVLFAGDAAGLADTLTGEGIGQALVSGRLAADAILNGGLVERRYREHLKGDLGPDLAAARQLQPLLARPIIANAVLRMADANPWTRRQFGKWMWEAIPRGIYRTPRKWNRISSSRT